MPTDPRIAVESAEALLKERGWSVGETAFGSTWQVYAHRGRHKIVAGRPLPEELLSENPAEVHLGGANLEKQIENIALHGVTPVVAINAFPTDHPSEHRAIVEIAGQYGARAAVTRHFTDGVSVVARHLRTARSAARRQDDALQRRCTANRAPRTG